MKYVLSSKEDLTQSLTQAPGEALAQLKVKNYAGKYRAFGVQIIEVGIEFSKAKRQIVGWEVAA